MLQLSYFVLLIMNYLARNRKKNVQWLLILTGVFIVFLWSGNNDGPDFYNYLDIYSSAETTIKSTGLYQIIYTSSMAFIHRLGFTFYQYRIIVSSISIFFIYELLKRFKINISYFVFLYFPIMLFMDGIQIRNFLAIPFLILAFYYMSHKKRGWKVKCSAALLGAFFVHSSFIVYFIFLLIPSKKYNENKLFKMHATVGGLFTVFLFMFRSALGPIISFISIVDETRVAQYSGVQTGWGPLIPISMHLAAIGLSFYSMYIVNRSNVNNSRNRKEDAAIVRTVLWLNILSCYLLPFTLIQINYYRLVRNIFCIDLIMFAITKKYSCKTSLFSILVFVFISAWFVVEALLLSEIRIIIGPFFKHNIFLNGI